MVRRGGAAPPASVRRGGSVRRSADDLPAQELEKWLPRLDSHQREPGQSRLCCCYITGQLEVEPAAGNAPASSALQKR